MRTSTITRAEKELEDALDEQADAQKKVAEARKLATPDAIIEAEEKLAEAVLDEADAKIALNDANQDVIDKTKELNEVTNGAATDSRKYKDAALELKDAQIALKDANQEVIDKQNELHEVINGAAIDSEKYKDAQKELTDAQNAERDATDELADAYDRQAEAARKLKDAKDALRIAGKGTTGKQEKGAQIATGIDPNTGLYTGGGGGGSDYNFANGGLPNIDFSNINFSGIDFSGIDFSNIFTMPFMAEGGIVNKPTIAMIGESGTEAVIPLNRLNTGGDTYNITINSKIADNALPDLIVAELRKFNRRSGAIDIQVT
jgi:subtilisin family serine protease